MLQVERADGRRMFSDECGSKVFRPALVQTRPHAAMMGGCQFLLVEEVFKGRHLDR
jgi:hypothetical protein